jgi:predicted MPP superfamily phosphohydrolase
MKNILNPFILIFTTALIGLTFYMGWRLNGNTVHWVLLWTMSFLIFLFPTFHWGSNRGESSKLKSILVQAGYFSMGLMSILILWVLCRDLALVALSFFSNPVWSKSFADNSGGTPAFAISFALTALGVWNALKGLRVRKVNVLIQNIPPALSGFKIAQISDLHIGPTVGQRYVEKVVDLVESLKANLTVLTGDIVDGNIQDFLETARSLGKLGPKGHVFFVPGNHEYYWSLEQWLSEFRQMGITVLENQGASILHKQHLIWVGGVTDPAAVQTGKGDSPDALSAMAGGESADFKLLLSHRPGIAAEAAQVGFHLQLSGHTHGGQFAPWTHVAKLFHKYFLGLMKHGKMWIYVSPGTGSWGPPIRLGTTPEVTLLTILSSTENELKV